MRLRPLSGIRSLASGTSAPVSPAQRLRAWRNGFSGWSWLEYELGRNDWRLYLPDSHSGKASAINGPAARAILKNKLLFERLLGERLGVPRVYAVLERGRLTPMREDFGARDVATLIDWCRANGGIVVKPMDSSEGRNVMSLEFAGGSEPLVDKAPADLDAVRSRLSKLNGHIVTAMVSQAEYAHSIFPRAVNTIRVVTMVDPDNGEPFVVTAMHRIGTNRSVPTDNISRGGLHAPVDRETGTIGKATAHWAHQHGRFEWFERHPDTGVQIAGVRVPRWTEALDVILDTVKRFPMLLYVGWDLVIGEDGVVVIEGNHAPTLSSQVHLPYLSDESVRRFFRHHGVLGDGQSRVRQRADS